MSLPVQNLVSLGGGGNIQRVPSMMTPRRTHPITSAAAVLIHLPLPNGFGGTGDNLKRLSEANGVNAAVRGFALPLEESDMHLRRLGDLRTKSL